MKKPRHHREKRSQRKQRSHCYRWRCPTCGKKRARRAFYSVVIDGRPACGFCAVARLVVVFGWQKEGQR